MRLAPRIAVAVTCLAWLCGAHAEVTAESPAPATVVVLVDDMPGAGDLAVSGNGQTVYCLDDDRRAVVAIDPGAPDRRRDVVAAAAAGQPAPVAVASLPGDLLALVCTSGDEWSLRTHRIRPAAAADPSLRDARRR